MSNKHSSGATSAAAVLLQRQLKEINTAHDLSGVSVGLIRDSNVFEWEVSLMINDDCKYYGGMSCMESPFAFSFLSSSPLCRDRSSSLSWPTSPAQLYSTTPLFASALLTYPSSSPSPAKRNETRARDNCPL